MQYGTGFESGLAAIAEVHRDRANRELERRRRGPSIEDLYDVPQDPCERAAFMAIYHLSVAHAMCTPRPTRRRLKR
jgi:hypothetical protein